MKITRTIKLDDNDRLTVCRFLKLTDRISDVARCSMDDVFEYFGNQAEILADGEYSISALHQIKDIG